MRVSAEELDLEPAVYLREGSDLMAQLRDQLIMLPEIEELTPECNIDEANKDGIDIRMCIDYRLLNLLIKLSRYPLPLIDGLLVDFKSAMWFMSLDMASGFWAARMTERAKLISAFVCPFGHFQWLRMPFGLKNARLIYQSIINNCLWGFIRLPPEEEAMVDRKVLEFLNLEPQEALKPEVEMRTQRFLHWT
ncbi:hypothetical protein PHMEG_00033765 [Phytophthora megakarya]|uniref:Reverse transcriptase domain-containing protein n=1 Tax=Phytophthora megakarya TaxID=4795 RepID=A0A225UU45_9STRA|nr:hypothetical protein PHMEG_00033765 [Phytophthora megakarya]